jgi:hypothetical protein
MMNTSTLFGMSLNPIRLWSEFAWKAGEMLLSSAQVIGYRSNRMMSAGMTPDATDRREMALMGEEKLAAAVESAHAMAQGSLDLNRQFAAFISRQMLTGVTSMLSLAASRSPQHSVIRQRKLAKDILTHSVVAASQVASSSARVVQKGLDPIRSRVKGNVKRLAKRQGR